ncbi:MAG: TIGR03619 family F420-dependent LLM class oxidoreductase [Proteobacteria bacterium]|jgi:probable F420-dependent oxidoreductase|nr:TIGR03619 family F420-dependent LLM class oxidoreductase [Pseudomonadota bacterium]
MAVGLGLGLSRYPFDDVRGYWRWVELCELGGVDSIWQTDRLVSKEPMLECIATMAALAGATRRIRFGMNVASIALRDPLLTAKQLATVDLLSDGRVLPAFGLGSAFSQDYQATGTPTRRRGKRADEALTLISRLWSEEDICFEGEFFNYQNATISPRPVNPHIPLWIGGSSEVAMRRTARFGTGWLGGIDTPEQAGEMVRGIRRELAHTGRSIDDDHYGATFSFRFGRPDDEAAKGTARGLSTRVQNPDRYMVVGNAQDISKRVDEYRQAGCSKFVLLPIARGNSEMMYQTRRFIEEILPEYDGVA